jgi:hypothetical protein
MNNVVHDGDNKIGLNVTQNQDNKTFKLFGDKLFMNDSEVDINECMKQMTEYFVTKRSEQYDKPEFMDKIKCKLSMRIVNSMQPSTDHIYYTWKKNFCGDKIDND